MEQNLEKLKNDLESYNKYLEELIEYSKNLPNIIEKQKNLINNLKIKIKEEEDLINSPSYKLLNKPKTGMYKFKQVKANLNDKCNFIEDFNSSDIVNKILTIYENNKIIKEVIYDYNENIFNYINIKDDDNVYLFFINNATSLFYNDQEVLLIEHLLISSEYHQGSSFGSYDKSYTTKNYKINIRINII